MRLIPLLVLAGALGAQTRDPLPVPDLPGYKTLKADFHMHTVFSDGDVWPETRLAEAWRDGLDAIAITDHAGYNPHREDVRLDLRRPHEIIRGNAERLGIIAIPGVEVMEGDLHCNGLFVTDPNALMDLKLLPALRKLREQNAFVFWNHPGWKEKPRWFPPIAAAYDEKLIQGMEIVNGADFYAEAYPWIEERKLTIFADSDVHAPIAADYERRGRPVTLVFAATRDAQGVRDALAARRTAAWMNGELWGAAEHLAALWYASVKIENPELAFTPDSRFSVLRLRNASAIPFRTRLEKTPEWLRVRAAEIRPESVTALGVDVSRQAPKGTHALELELELTNVHIGPGENLVIRVPVQVSIG